jgi:hypothetical protein
VNPGHLTFKKLSEPSKSHRRAVQAGVAAERGEVQLGDCRKPLPELLRCVNSDAAMAHQQQQQMLMQVRVASLQPLTPATGKNLSNVWLV